MSDDKKRGLYNKYKVERNDGKPVGDCIVLEFDDPIAREGIDAWKNAMLCAGYEQVYWDVKRALIKARERKS